MTARKWAAVAVLLAAILGVVAADAARPRPGPPLQPLVNRDTYGAGWAAAVDFQTGPLPAPPPGDDLTRASCRWRFDGVNPPTARDQRAAFLAGCDDATYRTRLEGRGRR